MSPRGFLSIALVLGACACQGIVGCASSSEWVTLRATPRNPLTQTLDLLNPNGPKPSDRTMLLLRQYDLVDDLKQDRTELLEKIEQRAEGDRLEHEYAAAELAYLAARQAEPLNKTKAAELYSVSLLHAYRYLFDDSLVADLNPYDPQFRGACDLYNQSLESLLRLVHKEQDLRPGQSRVVQAFGQELILDVQLHSSGWNEADFDRFEFVNDYQLHGLRNQYHTYGLGAPLIAIRRQHEGASPAEQFYPKNLCFPVTAFLRVDEQSIQNGQPRFVLEFYDTIDRQKIEVAGRTAPLETDYSTPLAYFLNQPGLDDSAISTLGLLNPEKLRQQQGLYMLEPLDPHKMPVVMVHGLWSSPVTWMEMFNDLRSDPVLRENYQFWFYLYPTGQPFWQGAAQFRNDLAAFRQAVDPEHRHPAFDQTVLVGHSMGGLVSRMQSLDSQQTFWRTISDQPIKDFQFDSEIEEEIKQTFFFQPAPSIRRVVTIGSPHRGSEFANDFTRWIGRKLIVMPMRVASASKHLLDRNRGLILPGAPIGVRTSLDSLAPNSTVFPALLAAEPAPWVSYHNIMGKLPEDGWPGFFTNEGDGVVSLASARLDGTPHLESQLVVQADHTTVHRHPQSVLEVRRILLQQLAELTAGPNHSPALSAPRGVDDLPASRLPMASPRLFTPPPAVGVRAAAAPK